VVALSSRLRGGLPAGHPLRGTFVLAAGALLLVLAHLVLPGQSLPLYDGFLPEDPYRFLDPPPGQWSDPGHTSQSLTLRNGKLPVIDVYTDEFPPQAQIFGIKGSFVPPRGATSFEMTIDPIKPPAPAPPGTHLVGNVYRFGFTTESGMQVPPAAGNEPSVVLRGIPHDTPTTLNQLVNGRWRPLETAPGGGTMRMANVRSLGDFVLIAPGKHPALRPVPSDPGIGSPSPLFPGQESPSSSPSQIQPPATIVAASESPTATLGPPATIRAATPSPSPSAVAATATPSPSPSAVAATATPPSPTPQPPGSSASRPPPALVWPVAAGGAVAIAALGLLVALRRRRPRD
jgi:hypothetical protein